MNSNKKESTEKIFKILGCNKQDLEDLLESLHLMLTLVAISEYDVKERDSMLWAHETFRRLVLELQKDC